MQRETWTVSEAAKILGVGRLTAYNAVRTGGIPALRIGRRLVVPKGALGKLLMEAGQRDEMEEVRPQAEMPHRSACQRPVGSETLRATFNKRRRSRAGRASS